VCGNQTRFDGVRPIATGNGWICPGSAAARLRCLEASGRARGVHSGLARSAATASRIDQLVLDRNSIITATLLANLIARRLAIWLAARPQETIFAQGLGRFAETGVIGPTLKMQLRMRARSGTYTDRSQAARLLEYCIGAAAPTSGRSARTSAAPCDQIDQADMMLARLQTGPGKASPSRTGLARDRRPRIIALAQRNPAARPSPLSSTHHRQHHPVRHRHPRRRT